METAFIPRRTDWHDVLSIGLHVQSMMSNASTREHDDLQGLHMWALPRPPRRKQSLALRRQTLLTPTPGVPTQ